MKSREGACQMCENVLSSIMLGEWFPPSSQPIGAGEVIYLGVFHGAGRYPQQRGINHLCHGERPFLCPRREMMAGGQV